MSNSSFEIDTSSKFVNSKQFEVKALWKCQFLFFFFSELNFNTRRDYGEIKMLSAPILHQLIWQWSMILYLGCNLQVRDIYLHCLNQMKPWRGMTILTKLRLCLVTVFVFYFQIFFFGEYKEKKNSCIFEIKNMFG